MGAVRQTPDRRATARGACSLAMALVLGRSVTPLDFDREHREAPAPGEGPRSSGARRTAFRNACSYLERCGFALESDPSRRGAVRLNAAASLAPVRKLAELDREPELLEDLSHMLVALADAFEGVNAVEAHGAAAKLLRDFALNGPRRELAPATTHDQRILRDAMAGRFRVMVEYEREDGRRVQRVLEPLRHVNVEGRDFLVAVDRHDRVVKTFHYDRIGMVRALDETFRPRSLDLGNLFSPPFGYKIDRMGSSVPADVVFRVPAEREAAVRAELTRLLCNGSGTWEHDGDDFLWTVHGELPERAASFALELGIEVRTPLTYRTAYLDAISAARKALLGDADDAPGPRRGEPGWGAANDCARTSRKGRTGGARGGESA